MVFPDTPQLVILLGLLLHVFQPFFSSQILGINLQEMLPGHLPNQKYREIFETFITILRIQNSHFY